MRGSLVTYPRAEQQMWVGRPWLKAFEGKNKLKLEASAMAFRSMGRSAG